MLKVTYEASNESATPRPYPKLMVSNDGDIFFMVRPNYGLPLTGKPWSYFDENFADFSNTGRTFSDYNAPLTIQNA